jgi:hypothetical protein
VIAPISCLHYIYLGILLLVYDRARKITATVGVRIIVVMAGTPNRKKRLPLGDRITDMENDSVPSMPFRHQL